jgi:TPR repeat protein
LFSFPAYALDIAALTSRAEAGDAHSQERLGVAYFKGDGVEQSGVEGRKWIAKAAAQQYAPAELDLGYAYQTGWMGRRDDRKAIEYYEKAAAQNYLPAYRSLAGMCERLGGSKNTSTAYEWLLKGAQAGDPLAQLGVAYDYEEGNGVEKDELRAAKWYYEAAKQRNTEALVRYGTMLYDGKPVPKDEKQAFACFKAASLDQKWARTMLMRCYAENRGVDRDLAEAYKWGALMNNDDPASVAYFAALKARLTPGEIEQGKQRAAEWLQQNNL